MTANKFIDQDDYKRMTDALRISAVKGDRNAVMILLTLDTGLRSQELLNITHGDLDLKHKTIRIKTLKKGLQRVLPMPSYFEAYIRGCAEPEANACVFAISRQRLYQIWDQWRVNGYKFHALRHTFARRLYTKRKDIRMVQKALGHKSLSSTTIYLDEEYSIADMRKAFGIK